LSAAPSQLRELSQIDLRQIGVVLPDTELARSILNALETSDSCRSTAISILMQDTSSYFIWLKYPVYNAWIDALGVKRTPVSWVVYSLRERALDRSGNATFTPVGNWTLGSPCGALLRLGKDVECYDYNESQPCEIQTSYVLANESIITSVFLMHVRRQPDHPPVKVAFGSTPLESEAGMEGQKEREPGEGRQMENEHDQHGDKHPPVTIAFGTEPLVSTRAGEMILRFHLRGVVVGFRYRIIVQEIHVGTAQVDQQESLVHCVDDDSPASSEVTVELSLYDEFQKDFRFAIVAYDAHEGLTDEEAIVARRDGTLPLVRKGSRISASAGEAGHDTEQGAGHDTEQGAGPSISSSLETHTFVFEQPPEPQKGYGAVRCASISVPTIYSRKYSGLHSLAATTTKMLYSDAVRGLEQAGSANVDVAVLPEFFAGHAPQTLLSKKLGGGWRGWRGGIDVVTEIARVAVKHRMYVVCPIVELANDEGASREGKIKASNTVVLIGRDGRMVGKVSSHVHSETRDRKNTQLP
jgi:hypothetical protein